MLRRHPALFGQAATAIQHHNRQDRHGLRAQRIRIGVDAQPVEVKERHWPRAEDARFLQGLHTVPGELVICSDVPLADRLVKKGVTALDPRGKEFSPANMSERLAVRNLFTDLREQGQMGGGPPPHGEKEKQAFANALDRILTRLMKPL